MLKIGHYFRGSLIDSFLSCSNLFILYYIILYYIKITIIHIYTFLEDITSIHIFITFFSFISKDNFHLIICDFPAYVHRHRTSLWQGTMLSARQG